jgi:HD-like signal output (HDOD) protein
VLQLANSAVFGLHLQVNEPAEAVAYLGLEATRTLVLLAHTFSEFDRMPRSGFSVNELWNHSVRVGQFARQIASCEEQSSDVAEQAYAAGLLHDLGKEVGASLLAIWDLPGPIVEAVALHHQPLSSGHKSFQPLTAVHAADVFAQKTRPGQTAAQPLDLDQPYLTELGLLERAELWRQQCEEMDLPAAC